LSPLSREATISRVPRIEFLESLAGPAVAIDCPNGGDLRDACDEAAAPVPFSCRSTSCGTCRVEIVEGRALLDEPGPDERKVLAAFDDEPGPRRLACTAKVKTGPGLLKIRACDDW
jgi:ferredoxin